MDLGKDQSLSKLHQTPDHHQEETHVPGNERNLKRQWLLGRIGLGLFSSLYGSGQKGASLGGYIHVLERKNRGYITF